MLHIFPRKSRQIGFFCLYFRYSKSALLYLKQKQDHNKKNTSIYLFDKKTKLNWTICLIMLVLCLFFLSSIVLFSWGLFLIPEVVLFLKNLSLNWLKSCGLPWKTMYPGILYLYCKRTCMTRRVLCPSLSLFHFSLFPLFLFSPFIFCK